MKIEKHLISSLFEKNFFMGIITWLDNAKIHIKSFQLFLVGHYLRQIIFLVYLTYSSAYYFNCTSMKYITIQKPTIKGSHFSFFTALYMHTYTKTWTHIHKHSHTHKPKEKHIYRNTLVHMPTQTWTQTHKHTQV